MRHAINVNGTFCVLLTITKEVLKKYISLMDAIGGISLLWVRLCMQRFTRSLEISFSFLKYILL